MLILFFLSLLLLQYLLIGQFDWMTVYIILMGIGFTTYHYHSQSVTRKKSYPVFKYLLVYAKIREYKRIRLSMRFTMRSTLGYRKTKQLFTEVNQILDEVGDNDEAHIQALKKIHEEEKAVRNLK